MNAVRILLIMLAFVCFHTSTAQLITKKESAGIDKILDDASGVYKPKTFLFKNVSILTMIDSVILENQNVLVENGIIKKIGKEVEQPDAIQIEGTGKYLMPGLTDMHVHLFKHHQLMKTGLLLLLINGVTSVRDMCGEPDKIALRNEIKNNSVLAPNLYQAGPIIDNVKDPYGLFVTATTPEEGRKLVALHQQAGYDFIKVYDGLKKDVFLAIVDEAHKQNILVVGHIPKDVSLADAIQAGLNSAEHLNGYKAWNDSRISLTEENYARMTANTNVWNCPTLYNFSVEWSTEAAQAIVKNSELTGLLPKSTIEIWQKRLNNISKQARESVNKNGPGNIALMKEIVLNLYKSNAKLIAGTDAGSIPFLVPGYSLHEELRTLHETGIPIYDVLKMTTSNAASAMNKQAEFGTIEEGKRADLLLLNANPLNDLKNLKNKNGLMIRGIWLSYEDLQKITNQMKATFSN